MARRRVGVARRTLGWGGEENFRLGWPGEGLFVARLETIRSVDLDSLGSHTRTSFQWKDHVILSGERAGI